MPKLEPFGRLFLGIDPGKSGGIALLRENGVCQLLVKMPDTERQIWDLILEECDMADMAVIEKVHAMPQQGVSSTFKFGCGYGGLRMALVGCYLKFTEVSPQVWQKALGIPSRTKNESKRDHKKKLWAFAQQLFPMTKGITLNVADALLIAEYCRRKYYPIAPM